ncbi:MAG: RNA-binding S4 domain-containing protein [Flavobacteriales bacterium]|nr:RNA-binding S4 domain-containing protein [Flavobacteriales bacterium]
MKEEFKIKGDYIELIQLLKAVGVAQTGGHAKLIVDDEIVFRNGELETRKRAKLVVGDLIEIEDSRILLT